LLELLRSTRHFGAHPGTPVLGLVGQVRRQWLTDSVSRLRP
jgi:hypothetical protein